MLQKERQSRVNKIKGVVTALKDLVDNALHVEVQQDILMQMLGDTIPLHESLMP